MQKKMSKTIQEEVKKTQDRQLAENNSKKISQSVDWSQIFDKVKKHEKEKRYTQRKISISSETINNLCDKEVEKELLEPKANININNKHFSYSGNSISFLIILKQCTFLETVGKNSFKLSENLSDFAVSGFTKVNDTEGVVHLSTPTIDIDKRVQILSKGDIVIADNAVSSGDTLTANITMAFANLSAYVDYIENDGDKDILTIYLSVYAGSFNNLTVDKITFGGDFGQGTDATVTKTVEGMKITIKCPAQDDLDIAELNGSITLAAGALKNTWGTNSKEVTTYVSYYATKLGRNDTTDAIAKFWDSYGTYISGYAGGISAVVGTLGFGIKIAELAGWKESTDSRLDEIRANIIGVSSTVKDIKETVSTIKTMIGDLSIIDEYEAAVTSWNVYYQDITKLEYLINQFYEDVASVVISIVKTEMVTVCKDKYKNLTAVKENIMEQKTYALPSKIVEAVKSENGIDKGYFIVFKQGLQGIYEKEIVNEIIESIILQATSIVGLDYYKINNFNVLASSVFEGILGNTTIENNPLSYFDIIVESRYNWDPQTHKDKLAMRTHIGSLFIQAEIIAKTCILANNPNSVLTTITKAATDASNYIIKNTGIHEVVNGAIYNLLEKKPILHELYIVENVIVESFPSHTYYRPNAVNEGGIIIDDIDLKSPSACGLKTNSKFAIKPAISYDNLCRMLKRSKALKYENLKDELIKMGFKMPLDYYKNPMLDYSNYMFASELIYKNEGPGEGYDIIKTIRCNVIDWKTNTSIENFAVAKCKIITHWYKLNNDQVCDTSYAFLFRNVT
ncbi:MAG: hypothetical protein ACERKN_18605 [Velocimicrobium sp.]